MDREEAQPLGAVLPDAGGARHEEGHLPAHRLAADPLGDHGRRAGHPVDRATKRGAEVVALNLRQWCSQVFRYAVATLCADHDPASALRGAVIRPPVNHSRPMDRDEIAAFLRKLQGFGGHRTTVIALRLLLLTFVRTIEMRKAEWIEVDLAATGWRILAEKMKMRRLHIRAAGLCRQLHAFVLAVVARGVPAVLLYGATVLCARMCCGDTGSERRSIAR